MKKLRLLVTEKCNRNCNGCCNKDWDLKSLPICTSFKGYDEIILTGGEPMIYPRKMLDIIYEIRKQNYCCKIYMYTATITNHTIDILKLIDGLTLTLHERKDIYMFDIFDTKLYCLFFNKQIKNKSLRLNVFKKIDVSEITPWCHWKIKDNMVWIKNAPLPKYEVFMRYK